MKKLENNTEQIILPASFLSRPFLKEDGYSIEKDRFLLSTNFYSLIKDESATTRDLCFDPFDKHFNRIVKRSMDLFFSTVIILFVLSWLIPLLAILIKSDSKGSAFFLQKRNKKNGAIFTCLKFRSMIFNEEADVMQARENDLRITRIGRFLRKTHIDELPQFINVLMGDMSVIGPRPHMITDNLRYETLIDHYSFRSRVRPGITGLAQILGYAGPITDIHKIKNRVKMDNFYIHNWSLKLDMIIFFKTVVKGFKVVLGS